MHWNPFALNTHFFVSNAVYVFALVLMLIGISRKVDTAVSFCAAWMLVVACLLYRVWSVCVAFPVDLNNVLVGILCAAPLQFLIPPLVLSMLVSCVHLLRNYYKKKVRIWYVVLNVAVLVMGIAATVLTVLLILKLDFSIVDGRWP